MDQNLFFGQKSGLYVIGTAIHAVGDEPVFGFCFQTISNCIGLHGKRMNILNRFKTVNQNNLKEGRKNISKTILS